MLTRRFFLTLACRECQLESDGTRVPTRQPRGLAAPGGCGSLLESLAGSRGPHGPGGCLSAPACGDFGPGPRFGIRHSPAVPHEQDRRGTPYSPVETVATHDIAAARTTAVGRQGLLDLHPQRASIQAPATATSGVGSKRPVMGSDASMIGTSRESGDKRERGKRAHRCEHGALVGATDFAPAVILGLVPSIHLSANASASGWLDGRDKPDHDGYRRRFGSRCEPCHGR